MGRMIYGTNVSLDGFIEDAAGSFDWGEPSEDVHQFFNDTYREIGTHLYGRRLYETMAVWETDPSLAQSSAVAAEWADLWKKGDKVVYSTTLAEPWTERTRLLREFDPQAVGDLKDSTPADLLIGGADLAAQALRAGLVDVLNLMVSPVILGAGKPALPAGVGFGLRLQETRHFANGSVHLSYAVNP